MLGVNNITISSYIVDLSKLSSRLVSIRTIGSTFK